MFIQKNPYDTSNISLYDVHELVKERNFNQHNPFNINYATYYGLEYSLKEFAGYSKDYEIKAFFEHGVSFSSALESGFRIHESLPTVTSSEFRKDIILSHKNNNGAYSIGPYIAYAKPLLNKHQFKEEKKKIGKNLLVFPMHSTAETQTNFELENFTKEILKLSVDFDSVTVCLYWKDVLLGLDKYYNDLNFNTVTAGYMTDPLFLKRLRSIIELSDMTISNNLGSHTGYCIYLDKPHIVIPTKFNEVLLGSNHDLKTRVTKYLEKQFEIKTNFEDFNEVRLFLSDENRDIDFIPDILEKYYGFNQVMNKNQLKNMIDTIEDEFSLTKFYLTLPKLMKYYIKTYYNGFNYKL